MKLDELIALQDGVVSAEQLAELGLSRSSIQRRLKCGALVRTGRGVFRSAQHPPTHAARLRGIVLQAGKDAVAYGPSAAWWHGLLDRAPSRCWVTVPAVQRTLRNTAHEVRRRDIPAVYLTELRSLAVTTLPLTVLEAAVELADGSVLMDRALQTGVTLADLEVAHRDNLGRTGSAAAGRLLASATSGGRSEAERLLHGLLQEAEIPGWEAQFRIDRYAADVAFPNARIAIEVDGWAFHGDAQRHHKDLRRHNVLENAGWRVLRFDWHRLVGDPEGVISEIRNALESRTQRSA